MYMVFRPNILYDFQEKNKSKKYKKKGAQFVLPFLLKNLIQRLD